MARLGLSKENLISRGAARFKDLVYLALQDKKLHKKGVVHTRIGGIHKGEIGSVKDVSWHVVGMCIARRPSEKLVVVSGDGTVMTYVGGEVKDEKIKGAADLRGCTTIEGNAYAFGMNRQVFRREREGKWTAMHAPSSHGDVAGIEAVDGFDADDVYAAGWEGEVWHWKSSAWTVCPTRTRVVLSGLCCGQDGHVYACGQSGTLLRGRGQKWDILKTKGLTNDLWDVRHFMGKLYVASMTALYELKGDTLVPVDFGRATPDSCYKLTEAEGVLWSIGQQNVLSFDGTTWRRWE
ncbi:hypothetical protein [Pendulispora albinea]|uniref:Uncharacterized protein n=1 Tax=Pendulispora albinea TaxID=2741071 RepID=A0ABZ2LR13_9BACT